MTQSTAPAARSNSKRPNDLDRLVRRGKKAFDGAQYQQVRELCAKVLARRPDDADALVLLGGALVREGDHAQALEPLNRALSADQGRHDALAQLGQALVALDRPDEARRAYELSLKLKPGQAKVLVNLGSLVWGQGDLEAARGHYEAALAVDPSSHEALSNLGVIYLDRGAPQLAEWYLLAALEIDPDDHRVQEQLAGILHQTGAHKRSEAAFRSVLLGKPDNAQALYGLAFSKRFKPDDPDLELFTQHARHAPRWSAHDRIAFFFAWGKALDDAGHYDDAFACFAEGNRQQRARVSFRLPDYERFVDGIIDSFTPELVDSLTGAGVPHARPIFILGMPRSGTTLTEQILASHPEVTGGGELAYFPQAAQAVFPGEKGVDPARVDRTGLAELARHYLAKLDLHAQTPQRVTDKLPGNFNLLGLIRLALPDASIVHVRRNPTDTCLSCFQKYFNERQAFSYDLGELGGYYRQYQRLMAHWQGLFPRAIVEVRYEDLVADIDNEARRLVEGVGLAWDERCLAFHRRRGTVRTASAWQVRQPVYATAVERWRRYETHLQPLRAALGEGPSGGVQWRPDGG